jgi:hypothetical protein
VLAALAAGIAVTDLARRNRSRARRRRPSVVVPQRPGGLDMTTRSVQATDSPTSAHM